MTDVDEDELTWWALTSVLTPGTPWPELAEGLDRNPRDWAAGRVDWAAGRVKALHARLVELQTEAGIRQDVKEFEVGPLLPTIVNQLSWNWKRDYAREREQLCRSGVRQLYFAVKDETLRKRLIRLQRVQELALLRFQEAKNLDAHDWLFRLEEDGPSPWARQATAAALAAILWGAFIGRMADLVDVWRRLTEGASVQVGAVLGAAVGLIGAVWACDHSRQMWAKQTARARERRADSDRFFQSALDEPETFTESEEYSGKPEEDVP